MNLPTKIPPEFYHLFWDIDVKKFNPSTKPYFVVQRMLDKGDARAVRWVEKNFGEKIMKKVILTVKDLDPMVANFWSLMLKIPKNEVPALAYPRPSARRENID